MTYVFLGLSCKRRIEQNDTVHKWTFSLLLLWK